MYVDVSNRQEMFMSNMGHSDLNNDNATKKELEEIFQGAAQKS